MCTGCQLPHTHANGEKPFRLDQLKSKFASIRFGNSKIKSVIIRNSRYFNRLLVTFEFYFFLSAEVSGATVINTKTP